MPKDHESAKNKTPADIQKSVVPKMPLLFYYVSQSNSLILLNGF